MVKSLALIFLATVLDTCTAGTSLFEGVWTNPQGVVVNLHVEGSKAMGTPQHSSAPDTMYKGNVTESSITWTEPADAAGEVWQLVANGTITSREGVQWTRTANTTAPPTTTLAATTAPATTTQPKNTGTTTPGGFPGWLHSIGLSESKDATSVHHRAAPQKATSGTSGWLLPVFGAIALFSFVALVNSRIKKARSTRVISASEPLEQTDLDEELVVE
jgi:hypothetical protein